MFLRFKRWHPPQVCILAFASAANVAMVFYISLLNSGAIPMNERPWRSQITKPCCKWNERSLGGRLKVNKTAPNRKEENLFALNYRISNGGVWKPDKCIARGKSVVVIPHRDRQEHLKVLTRQLHPMLQRQMLDYRIMVIDQADHYPFNRGKLMNVGFSEAMKLSNVSCFVFHDVDLIPEDDRNDYGCPSSPRHMCPAVDKLGYQLFSERLFGGVEGFLRDDFQVINGFPNRYWGWGAEDDDLYTRVEAKGLKVTRPLIEVGRYTMLDHEDLKHRGNAKGKDLLKRAASLQHEDGLSSLRYDVLSVQNLPLYTLVRVDLKMTVEDEQYTSLQRKPSN